jgi:hypothetical protein
MFDSGILSISLHSGTTFAAVAAEQRLAVTPSLSRRYVPFNHARPRLGRFDGEYSRRARSSLELWSNRCHHDVYLGLTATQPSTTHTPAQVTRSLFIMPSPSSGRLRESFLRPRSRSFLSLPTDAITGLQYGAVGGATSAGYDNFETALRRGTSAWKRDHQLGRYGKRHVNLT